MKSKRPPAQSRIFEEDACLAQVEEWRRHGDRIVFTNGCFDILHAGHIRYLETAAALGERLVIGVNDDASVTRLKGSSRPINQLSSRLYLLASLSSVDAVVPFSDDTPLELIRKVKPDVLAKGGDYKPDDIVGAKEVIASGGSVEVIPFVAGFSTTKLERRIIDLHRDKNQGT
jgi:D-beta-D-heptose 7-phosphate kinase/D-beta-D-heptose 1-phosphate adenosyltransferase